jgi:hypothetical protein
MPTLGPVPVERHVCDGGEDALRKSWDKWVGKVLASVARSGGAAAGGAGRR